MTRVSTSIRLRARQATRFSLAAGLLPLAVFLCAVPAGAQVDAIQVNLVVPAPTPYLADWTTTPSVAVMTVTNTAGVDVDATVTALFFKDDVEVGRAPGRITTLPGVQADTAVFIPIPQVTTYTTPTIADWQAGRFTGEVGDALSRTGRLQDGEYSLCVRFEDLTPVEPTARTVEDTEQCALFRITSPQPPALLLPADESRVLQRNPVFSWTPVVAPGVSQVSYELRVVEVLPGQTPTRALEANYPVFEVTVPNVTTLPYPPSALPLETGTRYAWRVRSRRAGGAVFDDVAGAGPPLGENQGLSEVFTFTRVAMAVPTGILRPPTGERPTRRPPPGPAPPPLAPQSPFFNRMVHGRLRYSFDPQDVPTPTRVQLPITVLPLFPLLGQPSGGQPPLPAPRPVGRTQGPGGRAADAPEPEPLAGVTVRLVVRYRTRDDWVMLSPVSVEGRSYDDVGRIVATATTDSEGRFTFAFQDELPTGVIADAGQAVSSGSADVTQRLQGPLARFYQIEVGDPHYLSPSDEIVVDETEPGDVGTLVSLVRRYRLRLHVIDRTDPGSPPAAGAEYTITVARQDRPPTIPTTEGEGPRGTLGPFSLVTRKTGSGNRPVVLDRLVRNVGPSDRYRLSFSIPEGSEAHYKAAHMDYSNSWPLTLGGGAHGEATFNEAYDQDLVAVDTLYVVPLPPRVIGTLVDTETDLPIEHAMLVLYDAQDRPRGSPRRVIPTDRGRFVWDIPAPEGTQDIWTLRVLAPGYELATVDVPTRPGIRQSQTIGLRPAATVQGTVRDPGGAPVSADVWYGPRGRGATADTKPVFSPTAGAGSGGPLQAMAGRVVSAFRFRTPAPADDTLHVAPTEEAFCPVSLPRRIQAGVNDVGVVTVPRKDRRVAVRVLEGRPGGLGGQLRLVLPTTEQLPVEGAVVEASDVYTDDGRTLRADTTDADGRALLRLGPGATTVRIRVRGPDDGDYETRSAQVSATSCGDPASVSVMLPPASRISGAVYQGAGSNAPVGEARVAVVGYPELTATTDDAGRYEIRGVPRLRLTVRAGGVNTGVAAQERVVDVSEERHEGVDFHLGGETATELVWSDGLLGFPVILTEDPRPVDGGFAITGQAFLPSNAAFRHRAGTRDPAPVPFDDVVVRPDDQGRPLPVADGVPLGASELRLRLFDRYDVVQGDGEGLELRARSEGGGALVAPVALLEEQFLGVAFEDAGGAAARPRVLTSRAGAGQAIESLTADERPPWDGAYTMAGPDGGDLRFRLHGFRADAEAGAARLDRNGLRVDATVHTEIAGVDDLALPATGLRVVPGPDGGPEPLSVDHALERPLQRWTLRADGWSLVSGMARLGGGELVVPVDTAAGSSVALPLASVRLLPDELRSASFRDAPLSLGGIVDLDVSARDLVFSREGRDGPWTVRASSGVTLPALPGMRPTDRIPLGYFRMRSDGELSITPESGTVVRLFDAADFRVRSVVPGETVLALGGGLDPGIPDVAPQTHAILYRPSASGLRFEMVPIDIGPVDIGGARLTIEDGVVDSTGFHGGGYVEVPGQFRVTTDFRRTPPSRGDIIEAVPADGATIDVGEIAIDDLEGGARFLDGRWRTSFDGGLDVGGEVGGRLTFAMEGPDMNIGTGGLSVRNVETPFGDLTITVNFPLERIEGSMDIDGYITDGLYGNGRAQMVMSGAPGNRYWHVYAGMGFILESPRLEGSAAFVVGNTTLDGALLADFNRYSVHGVPPSFYRVRGFFLEGQVDYPIPICPSGGVDIGVAQVGIWCNVRGDLRMGMNFLEANTYYIGGLVGLSVGASGSFGLGACVSLWGQADASADLEGSYRSDGAWYVLGRANVDLRGGASYGVGVDDVCLDHSTSFSIGLGAEAQLGRNWNTGEGRFVRVFYR